MKASFYTAAAVLFLTTNIFADSINTLGTATGGPVTIPSTLSFYNSQTPYNAITPISTDTQVPFWNNPSIDNLVTGHYANIGDVLGGLATGSNLIGTDLTGTVGTGDQINGTYYSAAGGTDPNTGGTTQTVNGQSGMTTPLEFSFTRSATAYNIVLLFASSTLNSGAGTNNLGGPGDTFGYYTGSGSSISLTPIGQPTNDTAGTSVSYGSLAATGTYGFYLKVCYGVTPADCVVYTTGDGNFGGQGNETGAESWNHFAVFQLASGAIVLGMDDGDAALGSVNGTEGIGDFNDIVIELQPQNPQIITGSIPEPGTIGIMGLGLAALGFLGRRRFMKN